MRRAAGTAADDNQAVVLERLKVYHARHAPLVEYYRGRPTFRAVDGAQAPDVVAAGLVDAARFGQKRRLVGREPAVIVCRSLAELEKMRAANGWWARCSRELAAKVGAGCDHGRSRCPGREG